MASQLALHPRTLQRRLAEEGTTFEQVVDDVRRRMTERYLQDTDMSLGHLARELGYGEQSALTRASRRWFGSSPLAYRKAMRGSMCPPPNPRSELMTCPRQLPDPHRGERSATPLPGT